MIIPFEELIFALYGLLPLFRKDCTKIFKSSKLHFDICLAWKRVPANFYLALAITFLSTS